MTTIRIQCAWCLANMGTKEAEESKNPTPRRVSHSICPTCYAKVTRETAMDARRKALKAAFRLKTTAMLPSV